ncbi:hypothetical protein BC826DRAFT_1181491 [Russula brevipes]|nr:hypothetical protein BC826DRAFT_1181491 [Russula brevipes]
MACDRDRAELSNRYQSRRTICPAGLDRNGKNGNLASMRAHKGLRCQRCVGSGIKKLRDEFKRYHDTTESPRCGDSRTGPTSQGFAPGECLNVKRGRAEQKHPGETESGTVFVDKFEVIFNTLRKSSLRHPLDLRGWERRGRKGKREGSIRRRWKMKDTSALILVGPSKGWRYRQLTMKDVKQL